MMEIKEDKETAYTFTSEAVTEGHPDKMCDQIADGILDAIFTKDPAARTAIEVTASNGLIHVFGEVKTKALIDYKKIVRDTIHHIGYKADELSSTGEFYNVLININEQSPDIALGLNKRVLGAGDQGMMFGYATDETRELMPLTHVLSQKLCKRLAQARKNGEIPYLKPDGKAQVSMAYDKDHRALYVKGIVVSSQHEKEVSNEQIKSDILEKIIKGVISDKLLTKDTLIMINPTGRFVLGGPAADSGLTGRKIIVDTYGSKGRHGGGAFSGKDPTKVDRSGAYLARYIAKNVVKSGFAKVCEVQIAYAIGIATPVAFKLDTFGTSKVPDILLTKIIKTLVDMRPGSIIEQFGLRQPIYQQFAVYGHFGREKMLLKDEMIETPWEKTDLVDAIKSIIDSYF